MESTKKKKIVAMGGGSGTFISLQALQPWASEIELSAVVAMSDSGGSSGRLRRERKALPSGDIMRAVLGLSKYDAALLKEVFYRQRFSVPGNLHKHNVGNIFLTLAGEYGGFMNAIRALEEAVGAIGHAYPATLDSTDLVARLTDGSVVKGEESIDRPTYSRDNKIVEIWLEPEVSATKEAIEALSSADVIMLGPGSLYTSIVAALLPTGIRGAIAESKAQLIFIAGNAYELNGETGATSIHESVIELQKYLPRAVDVVVRNSELITDRLIEEYKRREWGVLEYDASKLTNWKVVSEPFGKESGGLDPVGLGKIIWKFI